MSLWSKFKIQIHESVHLRFLNTNKQVKKTRQIVLEARADYLERQGWHSNVSCTIYATGWNDSDSNVAVLMRQT